MAKAFEEHGVVPDVIDVAPASTAEVHTCYLTCYFCTHCSRGTTFVRAELSRHWPVVCALLATMLSSYSAD